MNIVMFVHPTFLASNSMPRFARLIKDGFESKRYTVSIWSASPFFYNLRVGSFIRKWFGYIDQFLVFPFLVSRRLNLLPRNTLFVFADQALGPWVHLVKDRPHVIHVHDFMALRSALGEYPQNPTSWSGKLYQKLIRYGFSQGQYFISVSENTRHQLHRFLSSAPRLSEVVYNGLNFPFRAMPEEEAKACLAEARLAVTELGFLLHVGGNQWYKNRLGVLEIYEAYTGLVEDPLPLFMIGAQPTFQMLAVRDRLNGKGEVRFLQGLTDMQVCAAYSLAKLMLFPSIAEGFGWPIAEAMACGCLVLTTDEPPMTEVGGEAAFYISKRPLADAEHWGVEAAVKVQSILNMTMDARSARVKSGFEHVRKFDTDKTLDAYESVYRNVLELAN